MPKQQTVREKWTALTVLREKDGWESKTKFAEALGVSLGHLADLESGRREPTAAHVKRASELLNVPLSMLEKKKRYERVPS